MPLSKKGVTCGGYAFTNFHEFWAVSIEYFFENPGGLKDNLAQLYAILCNTLNQVRCTWMILCQLDKINICQT
jgi:Mlc titration factor MtfA (ptsG expression regulator)